MPNELCGIQFETPKTAVAIVVTAALVLAGCVPSGGGGPLLGKNRQPIPDVVGMKVERACQTVGENGHSAEVSFVKEDAGAKPGRVLLQDPKPGSRPGASSLVYLTVSGPFSEKELAPDTACANPRPGIDDARPRRDG